MNNDEERTCDKAVLAFFNSLLCICYFAMRFTGVILVVIVQVSFTFHQHRRHLRPNIRCSIHVECAVNGF
jgi:hypothetical protein